MIDYIDNIALFDHVLLYNTLKEDLYYQMFKIIVHYEEKRDVYVSYAIAQAIAELDFISDRNVFSDSLPPS